MTESAAKEALDGIFSTFVRAAFALRAFVGDSQKSLKRVSEEHSALRAKIAAVHEQAKANDEAPVDPAPNGFAGTSYVGSSASGCP